MGTEKGQDLHWIGQQSRPETVGENQFYIEFCLHDALDTICPCAFNNNMCGNKQLHFVILTCFAENFVSFTTIFIASKPSKAQTHRESRLRHLNNFCEFIFYYFLHFRVSFSVFLLSSTHL